MENAAKALKLAAWVLIFVAALSLIMNAFSQAKGSIDTILTITDREYLTSYIPPSGNTERIVSYESIVPAIYRAFKENYKIVFPYRLYIKDGKDYNIIDLSITGLQDSVKEEFIKRIIYGNNSFLSEADRKYTKQHFSNYTFEDKGLYDKIKSKTFKESIGIYYEEEVNGASDVPEASKTEKRVITYEEV